MNTNDLRTKTDALVMELSKAHDGESIATLYTRCAHMGYYLATVVSELHTLYLTAEDARKTARAKMVIALEATGISNAKASATVEASAEYISLRHREIETEMEFRAWLRRIDALQGVLSAAQMRLARLRDERKSLGLAG